MVSHCFPPIFEGSELDPHQENPGSWYQQSFSRYLCRQLFHEPRPLRRICCRLCAGTLDHQLACTLWSVEWSPNLRWWLCRRSSSLRAVSHSLLYSEAYSCQRGHRGTCRIPAALAHKQWQKPRWLPPQTVSSWWGWVDCPVSQCSNLASPASQPASHGPCCAITAPIGCACGHIPHDTFSHPRHLAKWFSRLRPTSCGCPRPTCSLGRSCHRRGRSKNTHRGSPNFAIPSVNPGSLANSASCRESHRGATHSNRAL